MTTLRKRKAESASNGAASSADASPRPAKKQQQSDEKNDGVLTLTGDATENCRLMRGATQYFVYGTIQVTKQELEDVFQAGALTGVVKNVTVTCGQAHSLRITANVGRCICNSRGPKINHADVMGMLSCTASTFTCAAKTEAGADPAIWAPYFTVHPRVIQETDVLSHSTVFNAVNLGNPKFDGDVIKFNVAVSVIHPHQSAASVDKLWEFISLGVKTGDLVINTKHGEVAMPMAVMRAYFPQVVRALDSVMRAEEKSPTIDMQQYPRETVLDIIKLVMTGQVPSVLHWDTERIRAAFTLAGEWLLTDNINPDGTPIYLPAFSALEQAVLGSLKMRRFNTFTAYGQFYDAIATLAEQHNRPTMLSQVKTFQMLRGIETEPTKGTSKSEPLDLTK